MSDEKYFCHECSESVKKAHSCKKAPPSELKNSFHTELAIGILLQDEETLEEKLSLLTELSLATTKKEIFSICEGFRERLCNQEKENVGKDEISSIRKRYADLDREVSKCFRTDGDS